MGCDTVEKISFGDIFDENFFSLPFLKTSDYDCVTYRINMRLV